LESVEAQTYNPIEVVVVDGSTRPVSRAFVEEAVGQDTTVVCRRGPRRGAAAARNAGIRFAEGDYLIDQFESEGSRIGVVYTGQRSVDAKGRTIAVSSPSTRGDVTEALLRGARMTPLSGVMVRRSIVDAAGLFDERLPVWEDLDWYIRLSTHADVESIADLLTIRRMAEHDQLTDRFETIRDVAYPRFVEKHRPLAAEYGPNCERAMVAARLLDVAHAGLENDEFASGVSLLVQALLRSPRSWEIYPYLLAAVGGPATFRSARWLHRRAQRLTAVWSSSLS
jgi:GT2 family glycosyltransferase